MDTNKTTGIVNEEIITEELSLQTDESASQPDQSADAPETNQPVSASVFVPEQEFCTPIQAANRMDKEPQYIYYLLRNNKVPAEHIKLWPKGDGTMRELLYESFFTWYENRGSFRAAGKKSAKVVIVQAAAAPAPVIDMDALMAMMAARLEASGDKKFKGLADAIKAANTGAVNA